jgi:hypothetical protein
MPCGQPPASLKRPHALEHGRTPTMTAIAIIVGFLVVMFAINFFEFGRLD